MRSSTAIDELLEICHGAPFDEDHYIFDGNDAHMALQAAQRPLCLYGHTHLPAIFRIVDQEMESFEGDAPDPNRETIIPLQRGTQYLVNAGAVGQPRDGDPRAGFAIADTARREVTLYRTEYPVEKAQARILSEGLPEVLAHRLALGR